MDREIWIALITAGTTIIVIGVPAWIAAIQSTKSHRIVNSQRAGMEHKIASLEQQIRELVLKLADAIGE